MLLRGFLQDNLMFSSGWTLLALLFSLVAQLFVFLRWVHRRMRDDEIQRAFVRDLALRHLPRIYGALHTIAEKQGITLEEIPLVQFVDLNSNHRRS